MVQNYPSSLSGYSQNIQQEQIVILPNILASNHKIINELTTLRPLNKTIVINKTTVIAKTFPYPPSLVTLYIPLGV